MLVAFCCTGGGEQRAASQEEGIGWEVESSTDFLSGQGLRKVESIVCDRSVGVLYASSGENYEVGTSGFISRISLEGELLDLRWVERLNRPTGMALADSILYVADVNRLVAINTADASVIATFESPIANPGLNDVVVSEAGEVFISASAIHGVFKLNDGHLELWLQDEKNLEWANGLAVKDQQILVAGMNLSSVNMSTKSVSKMTIDSEIQDFEGIVPDGFGGFFLTTVGNSALYHLDPKNNITRLDSGIAYFGDLAFDGPTRSVFVPRGNASSEEYFISRYSLRESAEGR